MSAINDSLQDIDDTPRKAWRSRRLRRHLRGPRSEELNIVSMIDVFAVLVFFLLVSSSIAAARLNILSLNLPSNRIQVVEKPQHRLTVSVLKDALVVSDGSGVIHRLNNSPAGYDIPALATVLLKCKKAAPGETNLILLVDPDVPYEHVVRVMDAARDAPVDPRATGQPREMYPVISIGLTPGAAL